MKDVETILADKLRLDQRERHRRSECPQLAPDGFSGVLRTMIAAGAIHDDLIDEPGGEKRSPDGRSTLDQHPRDPVTDQRLGHGRYPRPAADRCHLVNATSRRLESG